MIRSLSQEELAERWKEIKPYIERATAHGIGETSAHDMFVGAMNGSYECWEAFDDNYNTLSLVWLESTDLNVITNYKS